MKLLLDLFIIFPLYLLQILRIAICNTANRHGLGIAEQLRPKGHWEGQISQFLKVTREVTAINVNGTVRHGMPASLRDKLGYPIKCFMKHEISGYSEFKSGVNSR